MWGSLPFNLFKHHKPNWLDEYVQQLIHQVTPAGTRAENDGEERAQTSAVNEEDTAQANLSYQVFETHQSVIARIRIPASLNPAAIKVALNAYQLRLSGLPMGKKQVIQLPSAVKIDSAKALCRDLILEVRALKDPYESYRQINVQHV